MATCGSMQCRQCRSMWSVYRRSSEPPTEARMTSRRASGTREYVPFSMGPKAQVALGGDDDIVPDVFEGLSEDALVVMRVCVRTIDLGGIEEGIPQVVGVPNYADGLALVGRLAVGVRKSHAAKADGRYAQVFAERSLLHDLTPFLAAVIWRDSFQRARPASPRPGRRTRASNRSGCAWHPVSRRVRGTVRPWRVRSNRWSCSRCRREIPSS